MAKLRTRGVDKARQTVAGTFDRSAETYESVGVDFFKIFAHHLLTDVPLNPGSRVLDAGCGRGAVLFPAAALVGPTGSVFGIDLSPAMVDRTAHEINARGLTNANAVVMDAQEPDLPPRSFDTILSSCVVFFLPDPIAGLRAWRDLLKPGGRLGVTTFCGNDPRWSAVEDVFRPNIPPAMLWAMANPASPFATTDTFHRALESVGYRHPTSKIRTHEITFTDPQQWITWSWSHGQRVFWELIPRQDLPAARSEVLARLEPLREPNGALRMCQQVRYTVAHR
ncbi:class I SAM-dependent methyltransferase [Actinokineospora iranica]|uniref:Methyltransferase domain-containing protein n=1 Tax=Actinokineospora iranica TaxID=1271860 RepID=A0A1G6YJ94_9PSEU|nr:class I SAM-dependent methyltransferase [Actinokineospora iranica]SDD90361.1 Methyltransferase domain-containing protein [Actinokineospora iranica]